MEDEKQLILGFLLRWGIKFQLYKKVSEIDWGSISARTLLSAAESSAAINHLLSSQLVLAANMHGLHTILLQHGIWVEPFQDRVIGFASSTVLSWGSEHEMFFKNGRHNVLGLESPYGLMTGNRFVCAGSPKFFDSQLKPSSELLKWRLGIDVSRYCDLILIGLNFRWDAHDEMAKIIALREIKKLINENEDVFFVVKLHPAERHFDYGELKTNNSLVLDDIILGCLDLSISRLVCGVSTIISSLSTLLLDGAVIGRRCLQYDTGNKFNYHGCKPVPMHELSSVIKRPEISSLNANEFMAHYNDAGNDFFYQVLSRCMNDPVVNAFSLQRYSDVKVAEDLWFKMRWSKKKNKLKDKVKQIFKNFKTINFQRKTE
jgi:hypothetical protein